MQISVKSDVDKALKSMRGLRRKQMPFAAALSLTMTAKKVATWEEDESQSLFTKYFFKGMSDEGDRKPYGNGNGKVSLRELEEYLDGNMTYYARRYYGRTQQAQIVVNGRELSPTN